MIFHILISLIASAIYRAIYGVSDQRKKQTKKSGKIQKIKEDVLEQLYRLLDFDNCVIGGSYALKYFTNETWECKDINVMVSFNDDTDYQKFTNNVCDDVKGDIISKRYPGNPIDDITEGVDYIGIDEYQKIYDGVNAVTDIKWNEKIIQIMWLYPNNSVSDQLLNWTDTLGSICFKVDEKGNKKFIYNLDQLDYINHKKSIPEKYMSSSRIEKYKNRGYKFIK